MFSETTENFEDFNYRPNHGKRISWEDEQAKLSKKLKKALTHEHFSFERVNQLLDEMNPNVARELFTEKRNDIDAIWIKRFFDLANKHAEQGKYNSELFKEIVTKLMRVAYSAVHSGFTIVSITLSNDDSKYCPQLREDFEEISDIIGKEFLTMTLIEGDLESFDRILLIMDKEAAKEALTESADGLDAVMMQSFLMQAHYQAKEGYYNSEIFKSVISTFLFFDFTLTQKVFYQIKEILEKENKSFFSQLEEDFQEEKEYYLPRQPYNAASDTAQDNTLDHEGERTSSEETDKDQQGSLADDGNKHERSIVPEAVHIKEEIKADQSDTRDTNYINNDILHATLDQLLSWLQNLPEWLQQNLRNSTPVKALIESIKDISELYSHSLKIELFTQSDFSKAADNSTDSDIYEKVKISYKDSLDAIDMDMIFKDQLVTGLILPTSIEPGNVIAGEMALNEIGFNPIYL